MCESPENIIFAGNQNMMYDSPKTEQFFNSNNCYEFSYAMEDSSFGPERGFRRIRPIVAGNAARERSRVKTLRGAFLELQRTLPAVPPDTKLSKLDVLVLATTYIAHLMRTLNEDVDDNQLFAAHGIMHPVKKWPMRSRLYAGILTSAYPMLHNSSLPNRNANTARTQKDNVHNPSSVAHWEQQHGQKHNFSDF